MDGLVVTPAPPIAVEAKRKYLQNKCDDTGTNGQSTTSQGVSSIAIVRWTWAARSAVSLGLAK
jgi:hypothetical protein